MKRLVRMLLLWTALTGAVSAFAAGYNVSSCGGVSSCSGGNPCYCCDPQGVYNGGNCVWYTWNRRCQDGDRLYWCTDAHTWADWARSRGYAVCTTPKVGSIGVWSGQHVGYVDAIEGDYVWTHEQNCWGASGVVYKKRLKTFWDYGYIYYKNESCPASTGSLVVNISPSGATSAGAQWRVDGGGWQNSGATIGNLSPGGHTVEFKDISNWSKPGNQTANITAGQTTTLGGTYVQHVGSIRVDISGDAPAAGARWRVNSGAWQTSGATVSGLAVGSYTVDFNDLAGWTKPASMTVSVSRDLTATRSARYNRAPTFTAPGSTPHATIGQLFAYTPGFADPDGDAMTYAALELPTGATWTGAAVQWTPTLAQAGQTHTTRLAATDALGLSVTGSTPIRVGTPPALAAPTSFRLAHTNEQVVSLDANEPDGETISLTFSNLPAFAQVTTNIGGHAELRFAPAGGFGGAVAELTVTATDPDGSDQATFTITIGAPPALQAPATVVAQAGLATNFTLAATDPNGDAVAWTWQGGPPGLAATTNGPELAFSCQTAYDDAGQAYPLAIGVTDMDGTSNHTVLVQARSKPRWQPVADARIRPGQEVTLNLLAEEPDGDPLQVDPGEMPTFALFERGAPGTASLRFVAAHEAIGQTITCSWWAADADGVTTQKAHFTVCGPPTVSGPTTLRVQQGEQSNLTWNAEEPDGDPLAWHAADLPPFATLSTNGVLASIAFAPGSAHQGQTFYFRLGASDMDGGDTQHVSVVVGQHTRILPLSELRASLGVALRRVIAVDQPEPRPYAMTMSGAPPNATLQFVSNAWVFAFTPTNGQLGAQFLVQFNVFDAIGASALTAPLSVGQPPAFDAAPATWRVRPGETNRLDVRATDADGDAVTLRCAEGASAGSFFAIDGIGQFTAGPDFDPDTHLVPLRFEATDRDGSSEPIDVAMIVARAPRMAPAPLRVLAGTEGERDLGAWDPNGDAFTLTPELLPPFSAHIPGEGGGALAFAPDTNAAGATYTARFRLEDVDGIATGSLDLIVGALPYFVPPAPTGAVRVLVGTTLEVAVAAADLNDDLLALAVSNAPPTALVELRTNTLILRYAPDDTQAGDEHTVRWRISDIDGSVLSEPCLLIAAAPPRLDPMGLQCIPVNRTRMLVLTAEDPNADPIVMRMSALPANASYVAMSDGMGVLTFRPGPDQDGMQYAVESIAEDIDGVATDRFTLAVGCAVSASDTDLDGLTDGWEQTNFGSVRGPGPFEDSDGDGLNNREEWIAGTRPLDTTSVFRLELEDATNGLRLRWPSTERRAYRVLWAPDLASGFQVLSNAVAPVPPANVFTAVQDGVRGGYFRIVVTPEDP